VGATESNLDIGGESASASTGQGQGISIFTRNPLHLSLAIDGGYDTNVSTTGQQSQGSAFTQGQATATGAFGTERANATIASSVQVIYNSDQISGPNPEINSNGSITASYSVSRRLLITGQLSAAYQDEPNFGANIGPDQRVGYFFTSTDNISASFQWFGPFSTVTNDNVVIVHYDDSTIGFDENRIEETIGEQLRWSLARGALVGEYRFQIVDYDDSLRNSVSHYVLGGIDYPFNERLNATVRGGATFRFFDDGIQRAEPRAEGTLNYMIGPKSSISCNASYGLEEPDTPIFTSRTTFRAGLQWKYWLTAHVLSSLTGYYTNSRNSTGNAIATVSPNEESYSLSAGLEYALTSHWAIHASFDYTGDTSDIAIRNYSRERYSAGLVVNF
jgi:opacity protein-like surface antigen